MNLRLTLRTLLAYLDDILEPAQAKDIGQKVSEVRTAGLLIDRIHEVLRRRRLTAPDVHGGDGAPDANVVAEYLDNTLPPQQVAEYEKACLEPDRTESDLYLAEVAACHQIRTNADGAAVEVPDSTRERLAAMIPPPGGLIIASTPPVAPVAAQAASAGPRPTNRNNTPPAKASHQPHKSADGRAARASHAGAAHAAAVDVSPLPDALRPKSSWRKVLIPAAVLLLALVWIGSVVFDSSLWSRRDRDHTPTPDANRTVAATDQPDITTDGTDTPTVNRTPTPSVPADRSGEPGGPKPPGDAVAAGTGVAAPMPPGAGDAADDAVDVAPPSARPPVVAVAEANPIKEDPTEGKPQPSAAGAGGVLAAPAVLYDEQEGVLLLLHADEGHWSALPTRSAVRVGDVVATPNPFDSVLQVDKDRLVVKLVGPARVEVLPPVADAALHLRLDFGAAIFTRPETTAQPGGVLTVAIDVRGQTIRFDLPEPGAQCGVKVVPRLPTAPEQPLDEDDWVGLVRTQKKSASLRGVEGEPVEITEGQAVQLIPTKSTPAPPADEAQPGATAGNAAADGAAADGAAGAAAAATVAIRTEPVAQVPEWLELEGRPLTSNARRYVRVFADEFRLGEPVAPRMAALAKEQTTSVRVAEYAVQCLGLIEAMPQLVEVLAITSTPEEIRQAAIAGLRGWLALNPKGGERLFAEIKKSFRDETAEAVYRLLWGFSAADAQNRDVSEQLVDWLDDEHIAVRELAFTHVKALTGRTYDYRPLDVPLQRAAAVDRWEDHIRREGGLMPK